MAIKDWKKYADSEWWRPPDKYSFVKIIRTGLSGAEVKKRGIKPHIFMARIGREGIETKMYFNRHSQALKAARAYMRSH